MSYAGLVKNSAAKIVVAIYIRARGMVRNSINLN